MATSTPFLLLVLHLCSGSLGQLPEDLTISTLNGKVRGTRLSVLGHDVRAFLGVPYAKPPLGELRFRAPKPAGKWEGVKNAANFSNTCYQLPDTLFPEFSGAEMWNPNTPVSEDCLYLNVWTPHLKGKPQTLPVLVWIYGGGFTSGTSSLALYDGRFLSQSENVVVVSMNYRLGALGFLSLPENDNIRGNAGLLDQQLALRWVADNIAFFGGDSSKVTLFGESAGAASVGFHLLAPSSHGLFHRAILQSGVPTAPWASLSQRETWKRSLSLASLLGCPRSPAADLERCLQRVDLVDIVTEQFQVLTEASILGFPFAPSTDGLFLPDEPEVLLKTGNFKKIEVLFGLNQNEGTYFLVYGMPGYSLAGESPISRKLFIEGIPLALPGTNNITKEAVIFQYTSWSEVDNEVKNRDAMGDLLGHQFFSCPTLEFARRYSEHGGKAFFYLFDHRSSANPWPAWMGVMHGYEIEFVFGMPLNASLKYTEREVNMSRSIMKQWANFARTGNPSNSGVPWPLFQAESQFYLTLNTNQPLQRSKMIAQQCQFWTNLVPKIQGVSEALDSCMESSGTLGSSCNFLIVGMMLLTFSLRIA
ncbi:cholinesterase-like [Gadus macrocephalus]|uniref:cholinesterase-like n=1 Tax=Gadus macrocephalus TaxID=80720 RepID=UPI0028CB55B6|nr:cholinesterase-like [Gadus macrocephalus]